MQPNNTDPSEVDSKASSPVETSQDLKPRLESTSFGARVKDALSNLGKSQSELATELEISTSQVSRLLSGHRSPDKSTLEKLSSFLGITPRNLVAGTNLDSLFPAESTQVSQEIYEKTLLEVRDLNSKVAGLEAQLIAERQAKVEMQKRLSELATEVDEASRQAQAHELESVMHKQKAERSEAEVRASAKRVKQMRRQLIEATDLAKRLQAGLISEREQKRRVSQRVDELEDELHSLNYGIDDLKSSLHEANNRAIVNYDAYRQAENQRRSIAGELQRLKGSGAGSAVVGGLVGIGAGVLLTALAKK